MSSFKPGNWVYIPSLNTEPVQYRSDLCHLGLELWEPKQGEWCWYKNLLVKVISINNRDDGIISYSVSNPMLGESYSGAITLEPFIGQLPTFIKDNT